MNFEKLTNYIKNTDKNLIPECEIAIYQNNEKIYYNYFKRDDVKENKKDMYFLFSASKPITCTSALMLLEKGLLNLEDPVSKYLPEFGELYLRDGSRAKNTLKIKHLFTMTGGFTYDVGFEGIKKVYAETNGKATTREMVAAISKMPLEFEPGEGYRYSLCHDVLAAVVEVITGKPFGKYLDEVIFKPLGMKDTTLKLTDEVLSRLKQEYTQNQATKSAEPIEPTNIFMLSENYESGGAGIISTLKDYIIFADALATGTAKNGYRLLKPETIELMRKNHLTPYLNQRFNATCGAKEGYGYGLGVRTLVDKTAANAHPNLPLYEFGWDGAAGAYVMLVPELKLSVFYVQHVLNSAYAFGYVHQAIRNLVIEGLELNEKN